MRLPIALLLAGCATTAATTEQERVQPKPPREEMGRPRSKVDPVAESSAAFVQALRDEYRAMGRIQSVIGWYVATQGETSLGQLIYLGHDRLFQKTALEAIA